MRTIIFYATVGAKNDHYESAKHRITSSTEDVYTNQLTFISFDLLEKFDNIFLNVDDVVYELKLGQNTWIDKDLRVAHNLLKLVTTHILDKI